jgi:sarcosine oxidase subunit gamma
MEHMGAIVARTGDETYLLLSASSSAKSFAHAVEVSAKNVS